MVGHNLAGRDETLVRYGTITLLPAVRLNRFWSILRIFAGALQIVACRFDLCGAVFFFTDELFEYLNGLSFRCRPSGYR
jgi:hypothetical protein